jgi:hypothetical protein
MKSKADAIFELRDAAEEHGRRSVAVEAHPASSAARESLLDARLALEAATSEAMESCHHCGLPHHTDQHA